jgi:hypothetical protein
LKIDAVAAFFSYYDVAEDSTKSCLDGLRTVHGPAVHLEWAAKLQVRFIQSNFLEFA